MSQVPDPRPNWLQRVTPHAVRDGLLDPETRAALLDFALANEPHFAPALMIGKRLDPDYRAAQVLAKGHFRAWETRFAALATDAVPALLAELGMPSFAPARFEIELVRHNDGDFYRRHIDTLGHGDGANGHRILSMVYYFHAEPRAFSGGALRLFSLGPDGPFADVEPLQNRLVAFPAWAPHEVRPIACPSRAFGASRFAVNIWARRAPDAQS